jgi:hypothetical protein
MVPPALAGTGHPAILRRQLFQPQHRNNVFELVVSREVLAHFSRNLIMAFPKHMAIHEFACREQGIDGWIDVLRPVVHQIGSLNGPSTPPKRERGVTNRCRIQAALAGVRLSDAA